MTTHLDKPFRLTGGVDCYNPAISPDILSFVTLNNLEPLLGRLISTKGYRKFQEFAVSSGEAVVSYGMYQLANRKFVNLYAFTNTKIYWFDFEAGQFDLTPIYTGLRSSSLPYAVLPWYDALYITKQDQPLVKIQRKQATAVAGAPAGRYGIVANGHLYLVSVNDGITSGLARVRWSDLEAPESWEIVPSVSEADFFDLEPESMEATGVSYQRGSPITYTQNTIWIAFWIGFPGGFRHEPLFTGIGNIFHGAVVRNKEVDYFIGADNIYQLNGLQLSPIGSEIFQKFIGDVLINENTQVLGFADSRKNQIFWVYTRHDGSKWSIVYNYLEKKWSERDPQGISTFFDTPRVAIRGHDIIDNISGTINSLTGYIDDLSAGTARVLEPLVGGPAPTPIGTVSTNSLKLSNTTFLTVAETFDFFFEHFAQVKEFIRAEVEYKGVGSPNLTVRIGTRKNQSADVNWSDELPAVIFDGTFSFFFRTEAVGKYIRFKFQYENTPSDHIDEMLLVSFTKVQHSPEDDPRK